MTKFYDADISFNTRQDAERFYYPCAWRLPNEATFLIYKHLLIESETLFDIVLCVLSVITLTDIYPERLTITPPGYHCQEEEE